MFWEYPIVMAANINTAIIAIGKNFAFIMVSFDYLRFNNMLAKIVFFKQKEKKQKKPRKNPGLLRYNWSDWNYSPIKAFTSSIMFSWT